MSPVSQDNFYWVNLKAIVAYLVIILCTCATTAILALFCSVIFRKTSASLMTSYLVLVLLFCVPLAVSFFTATFYPDQVDRGLEPIVGNSQPLCDHVFDSAEGRIVRHSRFAATAQRFGRRHGARRELASIFCLSDRVRSLDGRHLRRHDPLVRNALAGRSVTIFVRMTSRNPRSFCRGWN